MAEQIEYLVRVSKDLVIEWIVALQDEQIQVNSGKMLHLCWPHSNILGRDAEGQIINLVRLGEVHVAWVQVLSLPGGSTLLRLDRVENEWAKLEPVWARLLGELARLEQIDSPKAKSGRGAKPAHPKSKRLLIALKWKLEAEPEGITQQNYALDHSISERTLRNYITEAEEMGCFRE